MKNQTEQVQVETRTETRSTTFTIVSGKWIFLDQDQTERTVSKVADAKRD